MLGKQHNNKDIYILAHRLYPLSIGGMEKYAYELAKSMSAQNLQIVVMTADRPRGDCDLPFDVRYVNLPHWLPDFLSMCLFSLYCAMSIPSKGALVYANNEAALFLLFMRFRRVITNPHGLEPLRVYALTGPKKWFRGLPRRLSYRFVLRHSWKVVSLGGHLVNELKGYGVLESQIVNSTVGVSEFFIATNRKVRSQGTNLLFVGKLSSHKGLDMLIDIVMELRAKLPKIRLIAVGSGPMEEDLKLLPQNHFSYMGKLSDETLRDYYQSADILVMPTRGEGLPTVILEAMACGMPVVATNTGGIPEVVDSHVGYLIPPNDKLALRNAIESFFALSPDKRKLMSLNATRRILPKHSWAEITQRFTRELLDQQFNTRTS